MPSSLETRQALIVLTGEAVSTGRALLGSLSGNPDQVRYQLLNDVPSVIGYYADGSSALAADYYDEERDRQGAAGRFRSEPVVLDRYVKQRRAVAWASEPLFGEGGTAEADSRLAEVIQYESARPFRDTVTQNRAEDPEAVGWRRISAGGCAFCRMLSAKGAVFSERSARFASHPNCHCTAEPVFRGGAVGPPASALQYVASRKTRTPAQKAALRDYLNSHFGGE